MKNYTPDSGIYEYKTQNAEDIDLVNQEARGRPTKSDTAQCYFFYSLVIGGDLKANLSRTIAGEIKPSLSLCLMLM